jgi:hypothetical protein
MDSLITAAEDIGRRMARTMLNDSINHTAQLDISAPVFNMTFIDTEDFTE